MLKQPHPNPPGREGFKKQRPKVSPTGGDLEGAYIKYLTGLVFTLVNRIGSMANFF
jgi:hypothetical protein